MAEQRKTSVFSDNINGDHTETARLLSHTIPASGLSSAKQRGSSGRDVEKKRSMGVAV